MGGTLQLKIEHTRRAFLAAAANSALLSGAAARPKAVAFDALTTLDPRPIAARAEEVFPRRGTLLADLWRTRQFEYTWLRTLTSTYADFQQVTEESLVYAANVMNLDLTAPKRQRLLQCFWEFRPWPDARAALEKLKASGIRLAFLSDFTEPMLDAAVKSCGFEGFFGPHLSTDNVRAFKPAPHAYKMAVDAFRLQREEIVFAAFAGWDAAGARSFGFATFWVNRMKLPSEQLGVQPNAVGSDLLALADFVLHNGARASRVR
jgi:2-haloacid dehalogenase